MESTTATKSTDAPRSIHSCGPANVRPSGVPEEIRSTLFRPGVSGRPGGSGLGLAMVQRIASDHRGALEWRDADPGTVFTIRIPADLEEA